MNILKTMLLRKPARAGKSKKKKKQKKSLFSVLMGIPVTALQVKFSEDLWTPDF